MVASVTAFAYSQLGFVGVILVGLLILFMAVQSELQKDGMVRPIITERTTRMERMAREAEGEETMRFWRWARVVGAILTSIGLAGFAFLQIPH